MAKKIVPKKKTISKKVAKKKVVTKKRPPKVVDNDAKTKEKSVKFDTKKYVRIASNESAEKFKILGERVQKKEIKWAFFATENSVGMHYYLIL